jgi:hypothetical protein
MLRTVALRPGEAELAVARNGNAVIAFAAEQRGGQTRVYLSTRRASSSRFGTPRPRPRPRQRPLTRRLGQRPRPLGARPCLRLGRTRTIEARIGTTSGSVGRLQSVGRQLAVARLDAIVAPTGRTTVAWATHDGGEEQNEPSELRTNVAPAGRTTFAGQVVLDRADPGALATEPAPPSLAAAPDGTTLVGYTPILMGARPLALWRRQDRCRPRRRLRSVVRSGTPCQNESGQDSLFPGLLVVPEEGLEPPTRGL